VVDSLADVPALVRGELQERLTQASAE